MPRDHSFSQRNKATKRVRKGFFEGEEVGGGRGGVYG